MATKPLNILVNDRLQGIAGDFGPDTDGDFAVEGRKLAWVDTVDSKISNVLVNQMTVEQVEAIAETAIANAEATGDIAQQEWVNSQGFLKTVTTDGTTITGNGTTTSPLVAHSTMPTSVQNLLIENQLEVANRLVVDGSIVDVNGDQYPVASQTQYKLTAGDNITIDYANPRQPVISATGSSQYPTLVQKLFSGISVIYAWKGDTTSTIIAKSSSAGTVSGSYIDSSDSTMYVFSVLPAGISFYLGNDSSENLFYTESILSIPATMEDLESKQDKLIAGENITIDGNTISATGGSSSNVTYNRSTGELTVDGTQVTVLNLGMGAIKADSITTTSIVEGLGGILAGSFLQNEDGEDYILQKDVEAGYVKKTDLQKEVTFETQDTLYQAGAEVPVVSGEHTHYLVDTTEFIGHVDSDQGRWQTTLDSQVAQEARLKQWCQDLILGSTPVLNYGDPTLVMGNGGLVNLLDGQEWTAPMNGAIVCASGGLLSVAYSVMIDGSSVWESPLYALGIKIGGGESPSDEIPITAGQVVTASGLLSLGSPINVTFYKNKA